MGDWNLDSAELWVLGGIVFLLIIMFVLFLVTWSKLTNMRKRYDVMMNGVGVERLDDVLIRVQQQLNKVGQVSEEHSLEIKQMQERMDRMNANVGVLRYNAFNEKGSELSFSAAFVDSFQNGIVITGIHGREETYVYGKPLEKGESKHPLSPEEREAIRLATVKR